MYASFHVHGNVSRDRCRKPSFDVKDEKGKICYLGAPWLHDHLTLIGYNVIVLMFQATDSFFPKVLSNLLKQDTMS